jgi:hypothetical protein
LNSLNLTVANNVVQSCIAQEIAPKPLTWHLDDTPKITRRMFRSIDENWEKAWEAVEDIPD